MGPSTYRSPRPSRHVMPCWSVGMVILASGNRQRGFPVVRETSRGPDRHVLVLRHVPVVEEQRNDEEHPWEVQEERGRRIDLPLRRYGAEPLRSLDPFAVVEHRQEGRN